MKMRSNYVIHRQLYPLAFILLMTGMQAEPALALQRGQPVPEAIKAAQTWLLKDCDVGEQDQLSVILRKYKDQLEPVFINAIKAGPDAQLLAKVEHAASARFDLRQEALKTGRGLGVSADALAAARAMTRQEYIASEKEDFVTGYKSGAIAALGVVGGDNARAVLSALAADVNSPLQESAEEALSQLKTGQQK
jgi:hypothetical protein